MVIVNLTQVLGLDYFDLYLESDYEWKDELNESRYLVLSHNEFKELADKVAEAGKEVDEVHYIVYSDDDVDYWNLYYQDIKISPERVEIHFHI